MVVNYDLPPSPIEYIHRGGRTGRAGRVGGRAVTLWTDADLPHMDAILDVMARSGVEVNPELRRLVAAWKARKAKQMHTKGLAGVVSKRKGERKLAAKVVAARKMSKREFSKWVQSLQSVGIVKDLSKNCLSLLVAYEDFGKWRLIRAI